MNNEGLEFASRAEFTHAWNKWKNKTEFWRGVIFALTRAPEYQSTLLLKAKKEKETAEIVLHELHEYGSGEHWI